MCGKAMATDDWLTPANRLPPPSQINWVLEALSSKRLEASQAERASIAKHINFEQQPLQPGQRCSGCRPARHRHTIDEEARRTQAKPQYPPCKLCKGAAQAQSPEEHREGQILPMTAFPIHLDTFILKFRYSYNPVKSSLRSTMQLLDLIILLMDL